tara:strand:+ start:1679 stop:1957 length:279 start_codon:yes stop_codon:yes gene_type:complete
MSDPRVKLDQRTAITIDDLPDANLALPSVADEFRKQIERHLAVPGRYLVSPHPFYDPDTFTWAYRFVDDLVERAGHEIRRDPSGQNPGRKSL